MIINKEDKNNTFQIFRFSKRQYVEAFSKGHFNFSCPGAYIDQAIHTGNNEQGDAY